MCWRSITVLSLDSMRARTRGLVQAALGSIPVDRIEGRERRARDSGKCDSRGAPVPGFVGGLLRAEAAADDAAAPKRVSLFRRGVGRFHREFADGRPEGAVGPVSAAHVEDMGPEIGHFAVLIGGAFERGAHVGAAWLRKTRQLA